MTKTRCGTSFCTRSPTLAWEPGTATARCGSRRLAGSALPRARPSPKLRGRLHPIWGAAPTVMKLRGFACRVAPDPVPPARRVSIGGICSRGIGSLRREKGRSDGTRGWGWSGRTAGRGAARAGTGGETSNGWLATITGGNTRRIPCRTSSFIQPFTLFPLFVRQRQRFGMRAIPAPCHAGGRSNKPIAERHAESTLPFASRSGPQ